MTSSGTMAAKIRVARPRPNFKYTPSTTKRPALIAEAHITTNSLIHGTPHPTRACHHSQTTCSPAHALRRASVGIFTQACSRPRTGAVLRRKNGGLLWGDSVVARICLRGFPARVVLVSARKARPEQLA